MKREITPYQRRRFDRILKQVLDDLPDDIHELLDEVPVIIDDEPTPELLRRIRRDGNLTGELCGLYTGIPLTQRSVEHSGTLPEVIHIFRRGVMNRTLAEVGRLCRGELEHEIRVTALHEIGHHFGMNEDDLRELGYD